MAKDPVCGMQVDDKNAKATAEHQGQKYQFCSTDCKQAFERNPDQYARQSA
jgi:YHS domain-containing protein